MTPFFIDIINANEMQGVCYAEPYAGGAGTAINLLLDNVVSRILINDASPSIYSFWKYSVKESERFIDEIDKTPINLVSWRKFHGILQSETKPSFELGFATFFLSRTNRSGILSAGPIGGQTSEKQESAKYKIDCRFNKVDLISRIKNIADLKESIFISNLDAIDFLRRLNAKETNLVYLDPPYYNQGKSLYLNYYTCADHRILSDYLSTADNFKWVLSYDNVSEIREIYRTFNLYEFNLNYTAQVVKKGSELLTHSQNLILPADLRIRRRERDIILRRIPTNEPD